MFEDLKKQQRGGKSPLSRETTPSIPLTRVADPKRRIILLLCMLVLLGAAAGLLKGFSGKPESKVVTADVPSPEIVRGAIPSGMPTLDRAYLDGIADATAEEKGRWDDEAVSYLLAEVKNTPAVYAFNRNLLPIHPGSAGEIARDPGPWRFHFVKFKGRIEYMKEADYADLFGGDETVGRVHFGRVVVGEKGDKPVHVTFVTPNLPSYKDQNEPDPIPPLKLIEDGWVRGRGIFVKNYLDVGPDGVEVPSLLVVAMKLQRAFETRAVESLEEIPFQIIDDDPSLLAETDRGMNMLFKTYPRPLFRLVRYAEQRAGKAGAALRAEEGLEPASMESVEAYDAVVARPAQYRAKYFGGLGATAMDTLYVGPDDITDDDVNDAGIEEYFTGWIFTDSERLIKFVAPVALGHGFKMKTRIRYEGFFYKTQAYYARDGSWRMVPFLVLTVLEEVKPTPPDHTFQLVIAGGFILGICLLVFIIVREDKTKESYRRQFHKRAHTD